MSGNWKYAKYGMLYKYRQKNLGTGGTCDARYCYSVWMRHLIHYYEVTRQIPHSIAEFGPGDTIGVGVAALLCGVNKYYALDFVRYGGMRKIDIVFKQLLDMMRNKSDIPDDTEFPGLYPKLRSYTFPDWILTDAILRQCLNEDRIETIRDAVMHVKKKQRSEIICYLAPWWTEDITGIKVDMVFSQAVFEHIDDYVNAHRIVAKIARPGAVVSHQIDFSCHCCAEKWNGHWSYGRIMWKMVYGTRPYFLNRVPCSLHIREMQRAGIQIIRVIRIKGRDGIGQESVCREWRKINKRDLQTRGAYIIGVKTERKK